MTQLALSAIGRDRPGIVAEVTRALLGHSLNITDSQMAVLGGRFTMMLIVDAPEATDLDLVREELVSTSERLGLDALSLSALAEAADAPAADPSHIVTVYGVDHPGIVAGVSQILAEAGCSIVDINQTVVQGKFAMVIIANTSRSQSSVTELKERFRIEGEKLGVRIYAQREDLFNAMHRI